MPIGTSACSKLYAIAGSLSATFKRIRNLRHVNRRINETPGINSRIRDIRAAGVLIFPRKVGKLRSRDPRSIEPRLNSLERFPRRFSALLPVSYYEESEPRDQKDRSEGWRGWSPLMLVKPLAWVSRGIVLFNSSRKITANERIRENI